MDTAISIDPDSANAYNVKANIYLTIEKPEEATKMLNKADEINVRKGTGNTAQ